jgi:AraC family transcriptional regulator
MKLAPGKYLGTTVRSRVERGLFVTLSRYEPSQAEPWHVHVNPTIFVLIGGEQRDQSRRVEFEQSPLSMVFHPTTEPHAGMVGPQGMLGLNIEYDHLWLERHELRESDLGGYRPLLSVWLRLAVLRLLPTAFQEGLQAGADLETKALEILDPLVQRRLGQELVGRPRWLLRAEEFMHDAFRCPIRLRAVAAEAGVHPVHLARVFRQHHGCSVSEYLRALRLAEAGQLILRQHRSIAEAACEAGFADQAHLCRGFRRAFRFSPKTLHSLAKSFPARFRED